MKNEATLSDPNHTDVYTNQKQQSISFFHHSNTAKSKPYRCIHKSWRSKLEDESTTNSFTATPSPSSSSDLALATEIYGCSFDGDLRSSFLDLRERELGGKSGEKIFWSWILYLLVFFSGDESYMQTFLYLFFWLNLFLRCCSHFTERERETKWEIEKLISSTCVLMDIYHICKRDNKTIKEYLNFE